MNRFLLIAFTVTTMKTHIQENDLIQFIFFSLNALAMLEGI